jgi:hypothetical protein
MPAVAGLMILEAFPVTVERDGWDWFLYALSVTAAVTAIIAFLIWALELRRRPEVGFLWKWNWRIGWVWPEPPGRVVCAPGDRRDIRDLTVVPVAGGNCPCWPRSGPVTLPQGLDN